MNNALMFSKASDEWSTPQDFYDALHAEFHFTLDAAATRANAKVPDYLGPDADYPPARDALAWAWTRHSGAIWLNPPYSRCRAFMAKAADEARKGCTVVCLVPARTDTRWWHECVWDEKQHQPRPGVEIRFIRGRLKFGDGKNSAPFPSVVIIFRGAR